MRHELWNLLTFCRIASRGLGIPCVVGGAATSAAVYWGGQP